jgi:hypothetical protein
MFSFSSDSLNDRIVALRPYFNSVQLNDETGVHIIIKNWWKSQIYHKQKNLDEHAFKAVLKKFTIIRQMPTLKTVLTKKIWRTN